MWNGVVRRVIAIQCIVVVLSSLATSSASAEVEVGTLVTGIPVPRALAVAGDGTLYVCQEWPVNTVLRITPSGVVTTFVTDLQWPVAITISPTDVLYVVEAIGPSIVRISPAGTVSTLPIPPWITLRNPLPIIYRPDAFTQSAKVVVGDNPEQRLYELGENGNGGGGGHYTFPANGGLASFAMNPLRHIYAGFERANVVMLEGSTYATGTGAAMGLVYRVEDRSLYTAAGFVDHRIRRIDPDRAVTTIAGTSEPGFLDGIGSTALFNQPVAIAISPDGARLYVADYGNSAIRTIDLEVPVNAQRSTWGVLKTRYRP